MNKLRVVEQHACDIFAKWGTMTVQRAANKASMMPGSFRRAFKRPVQMGFIVPVKVSGHRQFHISPDWVYSQWYSMSSAERDFVKRVSMNPDEKWGGSPMWSDDDKPLWRAAERLGFIKNTGTHAWVTTFKFKNFLSVSGGMITELKNKGK